MQHIVHATFDGLQARFTDDGWFDATTAAKRFGKRLDHWLANAETKQYIAALAKALNTRNPGDFVRASRGRNGCTWLHPKLAVAFARWCDIDFAVWCDLQIDRLVRDGNARITDAERAHWHAMLELDKRDETSKIRASFGSHLMLRRKRELPDINAERERLSALLQPSLLTH
jgi:hypothetical protein